MDKVIKCGQRTLDLSVPKIMGILNVTPDSFSDGGLFVSTGTALAQARRMVEAGAAIIDIGGESTRPGAESVTEQQELDRVIPVIEVIRRELDCIISVDTSKARVMADAVAAGADMINDVAALRHEQALSVAAGLKRPVCLMHMQGEPRTMQTEPHYQNVVAEVREFLQNRVTAACNAGINRNNILIDPGFGFGKSLQHNLALVKQLSELKSLGFPILAGVSRKSMIGAILEKPAEQRLYGSLALAGILLLNGADILRVHDVAETMDVLKIYQAVQFDIVPGQ